MEIYPTPPTNRWRGKTTKSDKTRAHIFRALLANKRRVLSLHELFTWASFFVSRNVIVINWTKRERSFSSGKCLSLNGKSLTWIKIPLLMAKRKRSLRNRQRGESRKGKLNRDKFNSTLHNTQVTTAATTVINDDKEKVAQHVDNDERTKWNEMKCQGFLVHLKPHLEQPVSCSKRRLKGKQTQKSFSAKLFRFFCILLYLRRGSNSYRVLVLIYVLIYT